MANRKAKSTRRKPNSLGGEIIVGLENAVRYARGSKAGTFEHRVEVPGRVDVRSVRAKLGMSQQRFAERFGISTATLRNWEQGRRQPEGPARVLLTIIDREPKAVRRALRVEAVARE